MEESWQGKSRNKRTSEIDKWLDNFVTSLIPLVLAGSKTLPEILVFETRRVSCVIAFYC